MQALAAQLRRPFVRDAGVLQVGGLAALGVSFLLSVALARALGRELYGAYALVVSAMTTISLFKRLGQDYVATTGLAAAFARRDAVAAGEALVVFNAINVWSTVLVIPPALLLAPAIMGRFFGDAGLGEPLRLALLPPVWAMFLATAVLALQCARRMVVLTALENANNLALAIFGLGFVLAHRLALDSAADGRALVSDVFWGQAAASLLFAVIGLEAYRRARREERLLPPLGALARGSLRLGRELWGPFRSGLAVALDKNLVSLYPLAPILLLGALAPTAEVALLRVAMSYLAVPLLALSAISRLLMVKLPELHATQPWRVRRFFLQVTGVGGAISVGLTLPFVLLAPFLIGLLYGADFGPAARLTPLLALDPLLAGFGIAAGPIFRTYGRNIWAVWSNLGVLALGLPLALLLTRVMGLEGAALAYAGLVTTLRVVAYALCLRIVSAGQAHRVAA